MIRARILFTIAYTIALVGIDYLLPDKAYVRVHPLALWIVVGVYAVLFLHFAFLWWCIFGLRQPRRGEAR